jgi:hypothetical protein
LRGEFKLSSSRSGACSRKVGTSFRKKIMLKHKARP